MPDSIETTLAAAVNDHEAIGQIRIRRAADGGFVLCHREEPGSGDLQIGDGGLETAAPCKIFRSAEDAIEIVRYDDAGNYRPLKTAPNLRHGWQLNAATLQELRCALDYFYPGRLAAIAACKQNRLVPTPLRETLGRQSGMYRVTAKISDQQIDDVVGNFCKSNGGCLRTILWKRDSEGTVPSTRLPAEKYDPVWDQTGGNRLTIPLLCQEACSLLVNECRNAVKAGTNE